MELAKDDIRKLIEALETRGSRPPRAVLRAVASLGITSTDPMVAKYGSTDTSATWAVLAVRGRRIATVRASLNRRGDWILGFAEAEPDELEALDRPLATLQAIKVVSTREYGGGFDNGDIYWDPAYALRFNDGTELSVPDGGSDEQLTAVIDALRAAI